MEYTLKKLDINDIEEIKVFFTDLFTKEPWNDDWSDEKQLHAYITDLIGNHNSLSLAYFRGEVMTGISLGYVKHWYTGTEYCINEFGIGTDFQRKGSGTAFLKDIERYLSDHGIVRMYLQTDRYTPAYSFYIKNGFEEQQDNVFLAKYITE